MYFFSVVFESEQDTTPQVSLLTTLDDEPMRRRRTPTPTPEPEQTTYSTSMT